jgi:alkylation response protein AidB-like acyl-CoA dehydrogenase
VDLSFTDEQAMLKEAVDRHVRERYVPSRASSRQPEGWSRQAWNDFADLGLLGVIVPERFGGTGGGPVETMIVMEAFGAGPVLEPFFSTVILAGNALRIAGSERQQEAVLPAIAAGDLLVAFAHSEDQARYELANVQTRAQRHGEGWRISGGKAGVLHGASAAKFVVSARTAGGPRQADGVSLFLVDADAPGLSVNGYETQDGASAAELVLRDVPAGPDDLIGRVDQGMATIGRVADLAIAALAAEMVGCMQSMHDLTLSHLKTREQFGVPLGHFQVLQHRAVDMLVALEQARSMAMYAATMAEDADPAARRAAMSATKYQVGKAARFVGHQAIQLHGGLGITTECSVGRYFLRTLVAETLFGDTPHHLSRIAAHTRAHRLAATA